MSETEKDEESPEEIIERARKAREKKRHSSDSVQIPDIDITVGGGTILKHHEDKEDSKKKKDRTKPDWRVPPESPEVREK